MTAGCNLSPTTPLATQVITPPALGKTLRVIHFVADDSPIVRTAAIELAKAAGANPAIRALLVLDKSLIHSIGKRGNVQDFPLIQLDSWSKAGRAYEFYRLCREHQPDVVFIHSGDNSNWCRYASLRAGVTHIINANTEHRLPYGIALHHFHKADEVPLALRIPGIIMPSGFTGTYHLQLIRALACLREVRLYPRVFLTGPGTRRDHLNAQQLGNALGLENQVRIAPHCSNLPFLLMHHQLAVIGNPAQHQGLVAQTMAAGCATIGITHENAQGIIHHNHDGIVFADESPELLAEELQRLLNNIHHTQLVARNARVRAQCEFSIDHMLANYEQVYCDLFAQLSVTGKAA